MIFSSKDQAKFGIVKTSLCFPISHRFGEPSFLIKLRRSKPQLSMLKHWLQMSMFAKLNNHAFQLFWIPPKQTDTSWLPILKILM